MFRSLITRGFAFLLLLGAPAARALDEEPPNDSAANLSTLGREPDWGALEKYQATITHDEFVHLLDQVYGSHGYNPELIKIEARRGADPDEHGNAKLFRSAFRKKRGGPPARPALVDRAERVVRSPRGGAARRIAHRARSRPSRRDLGANGRALVQDRRHAARARGRYDTAGGAPPRATARVVGRESFARAREDGADHALPPIGFRKDCPATPAPHRGGGSTGEFRRPDRSGQGTNDRLATRTALLP